MAVNTEIKRRLEKLNEDHREKYGKRFEHFLCPILLKDEPAELIKGHVIPDALKTCQVWVPQRRDIDGFYGVVAESDFQLAVRDRQKSAMEILLNRDLNRAHRPSIEFQGETLPHYSPRDIKKVEGQTPIQIVTGQGEKIGDVVVKRSAEFMMNLRGKEAQIVVERNFVASVKASVLKAAHLTMFRMLGYSHVYSPAGIHLAEILRSFFLRNSGRSRRELGDELESHFGPWACMISPVVMHDETLCRGTILDNRVFGCWASSGGFFALAVLVPAANDMFCVFLPTDDGTQIDTYYSFLKEPPPSIAVKLLQFVPPDGTHDGKWETGDCDPVRIPLNAAPIS